MPKSMKATLWEYFKAILLAVILALLIRSFIVQAFKIPSGSMEETLLIGDHLLVTKFAYDIKIPLAGVVFDLDEPERGDIVVFLFGQDVPALRQEPARWLQCNLPGLADEACPQDFIKRVVGLPGDIIEVREKQVLVNGRELEEPYAQFRDTRHSIVPRDKLGPLRVPEGKYFVLGDNRDESLDSRFWGFVDRERIKGKAWRIYWSWDAGAGPRWERIGRLLE
ncbi:MAG: signal peptidase I [Desulfovibrionales bacterium]|nr:MAG: signal peptidase I [Desulfovibrionales bacterium]